MTAIISTKASYYNEPRTVKVGNLTYDGVYSIDSREFIDNDGRQKTIHFMDTAKSDIVSYEEHNKITRSNEYFYKPQTFTLGGKKYSNVVGKTTFPGRYEHYVVSTSAGNYKELRVRKNGAVVDLSQIRNKAAMRKFKQSLQKMAKMIVG